MSGVDLEVSFNMNASLILLGFVLASLYWGRTYKHVAGYVSDLRQLLLTAVLTAGYIGPFGNMIFWVILVTGKWSEKLLAIKGIAAFFVFYCIWFFVWRFMFQLISPYCCGEGNQVSNAQDA